MSPGSPELNSSADAKTRGLKVTSALLLLLGIPVVAIQILVFDKYVAKVSRDHAQSYLNWDFESANIGSGLSYIIAGILGFSVACKSTRALRTSCYAVSVVSVIAGVISSILSITQIMGVVFIMDSLDDHCPNRNELLTDEIECNFNQLNQWLRFESTLLAMNVAAVFLGIVHLKMMSKEHKPLSSPSQTFESQTNDSDLVVDDPPPPYPVDELPPYEQFI